MRAITRYAVRARISEVAIDLFASRGFDNVTVEQVAEAVGMSARSVHRYFLAKEDLVIGEPEAYGMFIRDALAARPADESVWTSLRLAYEALLAQGAHDERARASMRLLSSTPALRARNLEKHMMWAELLTPLVVSRLPGGGEVAAETVVQASLVCFDIAMNAWAVSHDPADTPEDLMRQNFTTLQALP